MYRTQTRTWILGIIAVILTAGITWGDVYYNVGSGQTYAKIQDGINAIPAAAFSESHIINIHADTPGGSKTYIETLDTDPGTYRGYQPTEVNRLIIQAAPNDDITIQMVTPGAWTSHVIRDSNVTFQGLKFTGQNIADPNNEYFLLGQYSEGSEARSGYLIYNCEFNGGHVFQKADVGGSDASWQVAYVNNHSYGGDFHGAIEPSDLIAGNLFHDMIVDATGGGDFAQLNPSGQGVHNTIVGAKIGVRNGNKLIDVDSSVVANNIMVDCSAKGMYLGATILYGATGDYLPLMMNNLQNNNGEWVQSAHHFATLAIWNAGLATWTGNRSSEPNSIEGLDPLFIDAANNNYRIQKDSPANGTAAAGVWDSAIASISGMQTLLDAYWNPMRDPGYDTTHESIGAMAPPPPPPLGTVITVN